MTLDNFISKPGACRFFYNLTGKTMYLNCLIENCLNNKNLSEAEIIFREEFIPKTVDRAADQTEFAYTYFLHGEFLLRRGQITNAKGEINKGFDLAVQSKGMETPKMLRRTIEHNIYEQLNDDDDFKSLKEQIAIQAMNNFNTKKSMVNYLSRGDQKNTE